MVDVPDLEVGNRSVDLVGSWEARGTFDVYMFSHRQFECRYEIYCACGMEKGRNEIKVET